MRVRSWPSRPFKLRNVSVVGWCLLAAALLLPSRQEGAPIDGGAEPSRPVGGLLANSKPSYAEQARVVGAYGKLPLGFEPNQGQTDSRVRFLSRGGGYSLFLTPDGAVLALQTAPTQKPTPKADGSLHALESGKSAPPTVLRMQLVGSNATARMIGVDELPGKSNYFIGNDSAQWRTNVPNYRKVAEQGVYPGINLVYYGTQRQLEYDFVIAPEADPHAIRLAFQGADRLKIDSQGNLIASVRGGEVSFARPIAYQEARNGAKQPIAVQYVLKGRRKVAFDVGQHDPSRSLVIDPILSYSTYLGGSGIDGANGIAVAPDDSAFITGETFSVDFPTVDALIPKNAAGEVAFVSKISPDGSALLYSTYLGCDPSIGNAIAVDSLGEAYITGETLCPGFPSTEGTPQSWCGDDNKCGATWNPQGWSVWNGFITKLNVEGTAIIYSTFLGDYSMCAGRGIAVDEAQNAYVTGDISANIMETVPLVPPETPPPLFCHSNGFQTTLGGSGGNPYGGVGTDAFLVKIDPAGSEFLYCTYIGGSNEDVGYGVAVDTTANAYVTGVTYSPDFPTAGTQLQPTGYAGAGDAFLTKVKTTAAGPASLVYSTYIGGNGLDQGNAVAVDSSGNPYVAGLTTSTALAFTPPAGAYQTACAPGSSQCLGNAFIAKFDLSASPPLVYFTYLGGGLATSATGIAVDSNGDVYVTGSTVGDLPIVGTVFQSTYGGGNADAFVTEINPSGSALVYSTYLGGSGTDTGNGIALNLADPSSCVVSGGNTVCDAFVAGQTCSFDFPLANPLQPNYGGNCDAFISKVSLLEGIALNPDGLLFPSQSLGTTSQAQTVTLTNGDNTQTITSITLAGSNSGDFVETNTCPISPSTLAPAATCTITVTFTPTATGVRKALVEISDTAPGSPQIITLNGSTSMVGLSASSLAFGTQPIGVASAVLPLTVTNNGITALTVSAISASGAFSQTNDCTTAPLQPTTNCVINITFTPTAPGPSIGALTISDNAEGSPQVVLLTGTGVPAPVANLSTTTLTFTGTNVGATSAAQTVTLTNTGGAALSISNVTTTGDFAQTNDCPASLVGGANCAINVTFTPTVPGNRYGSVTVTDNATNSPQTILLSGVSVPAPVVSLSVTSLTFGSQPLGSTSAAQAVTMSNTGTAALAISSIVVTGDFAQINTCGTSLAAAASCTLSVTFTPTASGSRTGSLTITDNAPSSPQIVSLGGSGSDFLFSVAPFSASVVAGNSASYTITVTPTFGFNAKVNLSCSGAPAEASCSVSPSAVTPDGTNPVTATATVTTTVRSMPPPRSGPNLNMPRLVTRLRPSWFLWLLLLLSLVASQVMARRRRVWLRLALAAALVLLWAACGAGGTQVNVPNGTPAGSYTLTMTGTSGSPGISHSITAGLSVQ